MIKLFHSFYSYVVTMESYLSRGKEYDQFVPSPWRKGGIKGHLKKIPSFLVLMIPFKGN